jgi:hypothetical protein
VLERGRFIELRGASYRTKHLNDLGAKTRRRRAKVSGKKGS